MKTYRAIFYMNRGKIEATINGRRAYPDRRWERYFPLPKSNEEWEVRIAGENPAKTVYFLMPIRFISTYEQRCAAQLEENRRRIAERTSHLVGEDWEEVNRKLEGGKIELKTYENLGTVIAKLSLDHGGWYDLEYYPREQMETEEYVARMQSLIDASRTNAIERAREVKYWEEMIAMLPAPKFEESRIVASSYRVHVSADMDWGLHEADSGYTIRVYPVVDDKNAMFYDEAFKEAVKTACEEIRYYHDPLTAAEDGDPKAVYVIEYARRVVMPWLFKKATVHLTPDQVREIDLAYHDRDFKDRGFETEWTMYTRRQRIAVDKIKIFRRSFFCFKCKERLVFSLNENGVYRATCSCGTLYAFRLCEEGDKIQLGSGYEYFHIEPRIAKKGDLEWFTEQAATPLTSHQIYLLVTDHELSEKDLREILRSVGLKEEEVAAE